MEPRKPAVTRDAKILDEIMVLLQGHPAGTYGKKDPGLAPIDPDEYHKRCKQFSKAGLPSVSIPDYVSGTREPVLPALDKLDAKIQRERPQFSTSLGTILTHVQQIRSYWNSICISVGEVEPDEKKPQCVRLGCDKDAERDRKECSRCRKWRSRHGTEWKPKDDAQESAA